MRTHIPSGLFWWILIFAKFDKYNLDSKKKKNQYMYYIILTATYSEIAEDKKAKNGYTGTYFRSKTKEQEKTQVIPVYIHVLMH